MRKLILLAGAAALAAGMPALAKPGKGAGHANAHAGAKVKVKANARGDVRARTAARTRVTASDRNGNGIADFRERSANACPPGLAKKNNGCLPPGQARKMFALGQRIPTGYNFFTDYNNIPSAYRDRVPAGYDYIYRDDTVYVVDPTTRLVNRIVNLLN